MTPVPAKPAEEPAVHPTGDGERSDAGTNYGDWRPSQPHGPHGYDFEDRFKPPAQDPDFRPAAPTTPGSSPWPAPPDPSPRSR